MPQSRQKQNVTISLSPETIRKARILAARRSTSISGLLAEQIETLTGQTKEFAALAQKIATDSAEPIKTQVAKTFKIAS